MKKIIFISRDASRTGAPIVFLNLLRWLKNNSNYEFLIILERGGDLEKKFKLLGKTIVLTGEEPSSLAKKVWQRFVFHLNLIKLRFTLIFYKPSLVYANTTATLSLLNRLINSINCPVICHLHELETTINLLGEEDNLKKLARRITKFIVVAPELKENLINNYQIAQEKIAIIPAFIEIKNILKQKLEESNAFIVGGCGAGDWRKGIDIFVQTAALIKRKINKPFKFIWVGKFEPKELIKIQHDIRLLEIRNIIELTGAIKEPQKIFNKFDCFFLPSREDPYPLVALEASALEKPIICFDRTGGMVNFTRDNCGLVVPYLDIRQAAEAIIELANDKEKRQFFGKNAAKKAKLHDINLIAPKIKQVIEQAIA